MYVTIVLFAVFNRWQLPTVLGRKVYVATQGGVRETFQVSKESSAVCS